MNLYIANFIYNEFFLYNEDFKILLIYSIYVLFVVNGLGIVQLFDSNKQLKNKKTSVCCQRFSESCFYKKEREKTLEMFLVKPTPISSQLTYQFHFQRF